MDTSRIDQFRQMVSADPQNELGHFSLGRAYLDGGLASQAIPCLQRAIELNPNLGRAYELLAQALIQTGMKAQALDVLTRGVRIADERGERLSRDAMIQSLRSLGAPVPELAGLQQPPAALAADEVSCARCGKAGQRLPHAPFANARGRQIQQSICVACWGQWLEMGTKVINELRLSLNEPEAQQVYVKHMMEFLSLVEPPAR